MEIVKYISTDSCGICNQQHLQTKCELQQLQPQEHHVNSWPWRSGISKQHHNKCLQWMPSMSATATPALVSDTILVQPNPLTTRTNERGEGHVDNVLRRGYANITDVDIGLLEEELYPCGSIYSNQNATAIITGMWTNNCNGNCKIWNANCSYMTDSCGVLRCIVWSLSTRCN